MLIIELNKLQQHPENRMCPIREYIAFPLRKQHIPMRKTPFPAPAPSIIGGKIGCLERKKQLRKNTIKTNCRPRVPYSSHDRGAAPDLRGATQVHAAERAGEAHSGALVPLPGGDQQEDQGRPGVAAHRSAYEPGAGGGGDSRIHRCAALCLRPLLGLRGQRTVAFTSTRRTLARKKC